MFTINVRFVAKKLKAEVAPCLLPKISGVKVTPFVTSAESSEQFWCKICQIWRICEPWESAMEGYVFGGFLKLTLVYI